MKIKLILILFLLLGIHTISKAQQDTLPSLAQSMKPHEKKVRKLIKTPEALGISEITQKRIAGIKNPPLNIALFAVDRRNTIDDGNSDVIMIISIDPVSKKMKMLSILRDTYVNIEGTGMDKINAAFAIGGPQLAIKTINQNFNLDIKDYINVDFFGTAKIIDALGGVNINVKPAELPYLNNYLNEIANIENITAIPVNTYGFQKLNGKQTVAYTRIRAVGNGDYERTERQRTVLIALFSKLNGAGPGILPLLLNDILPNMETSMSSMALFKLGGDMMNSKTKSIEQARFPLDSSSIGKRINNIWYLTTDLKITSDAIYNYIYKNIQPVK